MKYTDSRQKNNNGKGLPCLAVCLSQLIIVMILMYSYDSAGRVPLPVITGLPPWTVVSSPWIVWIFYIFVVVNVSSAVALSWIVISVWPSASQVEYHLTNLSWVLVASVSSHIFLSSYQTVNLGVNVCMITGEGHNWVRGFWLRTVRPDTRKGETGVHPWTRQREDRSGCSVQRSFWSALSPPSLTSPISIDQKYQSSSREFVIF